MQYWGASHDSTSHVLSHHTGSRGECVRSAFPGTRAGLHLLKTGGKAIDAAIAASTMFQVVTVLSRWSLKEKMMVR